jgi:heme exporter protein C
MLNLLLKSVRWALNRQFRPIILSLSIFTSLTYLLLFSWIFYFVPEEQLQGGLVKILFIHVPSAWIALASYLLLGIFSLYYLIYQERLTSFLARAATMVSFNASAITLVTGAIWGKAAWGTWWVWDPRLTSLFIQFSLLALIIIMRYASRSYNSSLEQWAALVSILGLINLPIIKFAVTSWTSLHQEASVFRLDGVKMDSSFLYPLIAAFLAFSSFYLTLGLISVKNQINQMKKLL